MKGLGLQSVRNVRDPGLGAPGYSEGLRYRKWRLDLFRGVGMLWGWPRNPLSGYSTMRYNHA